MLQKDSLLEWRTIYNNVVFGLEITKRKTKENEQYVKDLLKKYNLYEFKDKYPSQLSGGMRQRVALIRTLTIRPEILLLDEAFSALDYQTRIMVTKDIYKILKNENITTVMVTHDISEAISMSDRIVVLTKRPATVKKIDTIDFEIEGREKYLKKIRLTKILTLFTQITVAVAFVALWEILANKGVIDSFITSQPSRMLKTFMNLSQNGLLEHLGVTCYETIVGFLSGAILGVIIAIILWWSKFLSKVSEPFLVVLNSLPKIALRTGNNNMGRSRNRRNYSNGIGNILNSYNSRNIKWFFKYR